ncbi:MAG: peptidoglycan editing factor PgeF [Pseudomonadota bacterium]
MNDETPITIQHDESAINPYRYGGFNSERIAHGFFTRAGGVSEGIYAGLNCGQGSDDNQGQVQENRARVAAHLGGDLISLYQIHSDICHNVSESWGDERPEGDAFVTDQAGIILGILTADCGPVLFVGEKTDGAPVVGAAHAGWKGAIGGVLQSTVAKMLELGATLESIKAVVGPCIAKKSYEVDAGFYQNFLETNENFESFFGAGARDGHFQFDLEGFCAAQLAGVGVKTVHTMGLDTYALEAEFYSYRRKTHRDELDYGRQVSAIMIKD